MSDLRPKRAGKKIRLQKRILGNKSQHVQVHTFLQMLPYNSSPLSANLTNAFLAIIEGANFSLITLFLCGHFDMNLFRSSMYKQQIRQISTTGMLGDNFTQGFPAILFKALLDGQKKPSSNALQRFQGILIRSTMSKLPTMPSGRCLQQIPDQFGLVASNVPAR